MSRQMAFVVEVVTFAVHGAKSVLCGKQLVFAQQWAKVEFEVNRDETMITGVQGSPGDDRQSELLVAFCKQSGECGV